MTTEGFRLKQIRIKMGKSQQQFGDLFNVSRQYVSNMENGSKPVGKEILVSLLVYHNVNTNYILAGIGSPFLEETKSPSDEELYKKFKQFMENERV